jgi:hypothetical protein
MVLSEEIPIAFLDSVPERRIADDTIEAALPIGSQPLIDELRVVLRCQTTYADWAILRLVPAARARPAVRASDEAEVDQAGLNTRA